MEVAWSTYPGRSRSRRGRAFAITGFKPELPIQIPEERHRQSKSGRMTKKGEPLAHASSQKAPTQPMRIIYIYYVQDEEGFFRLSSLSPNLLSECTSDSDK